MSIPLKDAWRLPLLMATPVAVGSATGLAVSKVAGVSRKKSVTVGAIAGIVVDAFILGTLWQAIRTFN